MNIVEGKEGPIIGTVIGTAFLILALYMVKDTFIDMGWGQHVPYIIGAVVASTIGGVVVGIKYRETGWFRSLDGFIKKWGVIIGAALVGAALVITYLT